jgi:hypothetical protein
VETLERFTVSVNTWSHAEQYYLFLKAGSQYFPFEDSKTPQENALSMAVFLEMVVEELIGSRESASIFFHEIVEVLFIQREKRIGQQLC